jgi:DNA-binding transcriptional regulator PaaX
MENKYLERFQDFLDSGTPKAKITQVALCILAIASVPALVLVAASLGNAVQIFGQFKTAKKFKKRQVEDSLRYLRRNGFIEYLCEKNGREIVRITRKGQTKLRAFSIDLMKIKKPKKWDGKWRLAMFDIPIRFTKGREALRFHLKDLGFFQFQKSAWIYPYPCEDEIIFISDFYGVKRYVDVLTIESLINEYKILRHFNLL